MGWFWGPSDNDDGKKSQSQDPLRNLDPSLRDFLAKESPIKYNTSTPPTPQAPAAPTSIKSPAPTSSSANRSADADTSKAPAQSLYRDGRYAHLWKTYQSQSDAETESKSDQEKINDVLEGYKQRKAEIGRAALENCALEQWQVNECFRNGDWSSRLTLCRTENRELERCYLMQAKFLKALGYLSTYDRPPEVDERIQMHADTLYHRMLDQEKAMEAAKAEGKALPSFPPLLSSKATSTTPSITHNLEDNKFKPSDLSPSVQKGFKKRLEGLKGEEREVEERAIKAEIQAGEQVATSLGTIFEKQAEERKLRKEQGKETIGDKLSSVFGFR